MASPKPKRASGSAQVELDCSFKSFTCYFGAEFRQRGKAENQMHPLEIWRKLNSPLGRFSRLLAVTEHEPQLTEPRPGKCILRLKLGRLQQRVASAFQVEIRLLRVGQSYSGCCSFRLECDAAFCVIERLDLFVLDHLDNGAQGISESSALIPCDRLIDDFQGLVDAPDGQEERSLEEIESVVALVGWHPIKSGERPGYVVLLSLFE